MHMDYWNCTLCRGTVLHLHPVHESDGVWHTRQESSITRSASATTRLPVATSPADPGIIAGVSGLDPAWKSNSYTASSSDSETKALCNTSIGTTKSTPTTHRTVTPTVIPFMVSRKHPQLSVQWRDNGGNL